MVLGPAVPECGCPMKCLHPAERRKKYCECVEEVGVVCVCVWVWVGGEEE